MTRLRSIRGYNIALTGICSRPRTELVRLVKQRGGIITSKARVTSEPTILVRGTSKRWFFGGHGMKESSLAWHIRDGLRGHLVYADAFEAFLSRGTPMPTAEFIAGEEVASLKEAYRAGDGETYGGLIRPQQRVAPGERVVETRQRTEQARLRTLLLGGDESGRCMLCGTRLPAGLLVVAHIKPRAHCTRTEQADFPSILMIACQLGCDALYERGYVTVDERGKLRIAQASERSVRSQLVNRFKGKSFGGDTESRQPYFEWHRQFRFLG